MAMATIFGTSAPMAASSESKFFGDATKVAAAPSRTSQRRLNRSLRISALSSGLKSGRVVAGAPLTRGSRVRAQAAEVARAAKVREIFMPVLSSTMTEGKIVDWYKSEGDEVKKGEIVVVVESDKADMDVESFYDGYLAHIAVGKDEVAPVGAAIGILAETKEDIPKIKAQHASSGPAQASAPVDVAGTSPSVDFVAATVPASTPPPPPPTPVSAPALEPGRRIISSPYAKKLAKDLKVDLATVVGSGPGGRITADDVEAAAGKVASAPAAPVAPAVPAAAITVLGTTTPFTGMQEAVSRNMVQSLTVPTFRVGYTIATDALDALYKKIKSKGVTMSALLAKATALAVAQHPVMNASCKDGKSFSYHSNINIAVAVAIDGGLITPVLQDADKVDIYTLSRKWKELVDKARAKQLQPNEYSTGTFTLSNLGMFGVDRFDAILPPGTGAIMAVGASTPSVVATPDGLFGVKNQMQVNVTADHRIIYGADLAAFLQTLAKIIENPRELTL